MYFYYFSVINGEKTKPQSLDLFERKTRMNWTLQLTV